MEQPPAMPPTYPPSASAKKGLPAIAWVGIGCGGIIVIAIIVMALVFGFFAKKISAFAANPEKSAAEMIVSMNPDLEMISQDDTKGTMKIRTKDGKETTVSYKDIAAGKITVTDADGNTTQIGSTDLSHVPAWVPQAPDLTDGVSLFHTDGGGKVAGQFSGKSTKGIEELKTFFTSETTSKGFTNSSSSTTELNGTSITTLEYTGDAKSLTIVITSQPGQDAMINTNYSEK